eukprot:UN00975
MRDLESQNSIRAGSELNSGAELESDIEDIKRGPDLSISDFNYN